MLKIPKSIYSQFNTLFWTIDNDVIKNGEVILTRKMLCQYFIANIFYIILCLLSMIYCTVFCAIYKDCTIGWIYGIAACLIFDFIIVGLILVPSLAIIFRYLSRKSRYIYYNYSIFTYFYYMLELMTIPNKC